MRWRGDVEDHGVGTGRQLHGKAFATFLLWSRDRSSHPKYLETEDPSLRTLGLLPVDARPSERGVGEEPRWSLHPGGSYGGRFWI